MGEVGAEDQAFPGEAESPVIRVLRQFATVELGLRRPARENQRAQGGGHAGVLRALFARPVEPFRQVELLARAAVECAGHGPVVWMRAATKGGRGFLEREELAADHRGAQRMLEEPVSAELRKRPGEAFEDDIAGPIRRQVGGQLGDDQRVAGLLGREGEAVDRDVVLEMRGRQVRPAGVAPAAEFGRLLLDRASLDARAEELERAAGAFVITVAPRHRAERERQTAAALAPGAAHPRRGKLGEFPQRLRLAARRALDPAALAVLLAERDRLEVAQVVVGAAARRVGPGIEASADRKLADAPFPHPDPFGRVLRLQGSGRAEGEPGEQAAHHQASLSIARASFASRSLRPPASCVVSAIATRL